VQSSADAGAHVPLVRHRPGAPGALRRARAQKARGPGRPLSALACKGSVYALALNGPGSLVVAGTAESLVRVFDARTGGKVMKLRGHAGNVRRGAGVALRVLLSCLHP
jgi:hypothetical protein